MDDTHTTEPEQDPVMEDDPAAADLAALEAADPADAPDLAEAYAARLGRDLDSATATERPAGSGREGTGTGN